MKIMVIGAHSDDAELACGGVIAKAKANGHQVKMLVLTESGYTDLDGNVQRTNEGAYQESVEAAAILGVREDEIEIESFTNKELPYSATVIAAIERRLESYQPNVILTHWPFDTHQDHRSAALSSISAGRYFNSVLMYEPMMPSGRSYIPFRPQVYVDISDYIDQKLEALKCHRTEHQKFGDDWLDAVEARCRLRGYEVGCDYAESFEALRFEWTLEL